MLEDFARGNALIPVRRRLGLLEFQLNVNLADIGAAFFAWEEPACHQTFSFIKFPSLAQQLDQSKYKDGGSRGDLWKTLQCPDAITHRHSSFLHRPVKAEIHIDVVFVVLHPFAE